MVVSSLRDNKINIILRKSNDWVAVQRRSMLLFWITGTVCEEDMLQAFQNNSLLLITEDYFTNS